MFVIKKYLHSRITISVVAVDIADGRTYEMKSTGGLGSFRVTK